MDNPEALATMWTRHRIKTYKTKNTTLKTKNMSNRDELRLGLVVPAPVVVPVVLL
jgi:hypothetical protein